MPRRRESRQGLVRCWPDVVPAVLLPMEHGCPEMHYWTKSVVCGEHSFPRARTVPDMGIGRPIELVRCSHNGRSATTSGLAD